MDIKQIRYGIEIETVKRTREQVAWAIHSMVGGTAQRTPAGRRCGSGAKPNPRTSREPHRP